MTEREWLNCADPLAMMAFLRKGRPAFRTRWLGWITRPMVQVSERKWRLFYCACCARIAHLLPADEARRLITVAELYADGRASEEELQTGVNASMAACDAARHQWDRSFVAADDDEVSLIGWELGLLEGRSGVGSAHHAVLAISRFHREGESSRSLALQCAARASAFASAYALRMRRCSSPSPPPHEAPDWLSENAAETARQAELLREVIGNPFLRTVVDAAWLDWNGGTVRRLAQGIYEEKRWKEMLILADALEDAGCADDAFLSHCRGPGQHVRGCWALDRLLGKE